MMCCVGLIGGAVVGQALGGPWTFIAPAAGFGLGLVADMKMMKGHQKSGAQQADTGLRAKAEGDPKTPDQHAAGAPAAQSGAGCGIASGLMRMLPPKEKDKAEKTVAGIAKADQASFSEPPARS